VSKGTQGITLLGLSFCYFPYKLIPALVRLFCSAQHVDIRSRSIMFLRVSVLSSVSVCTSYRTIRFSRYLEIVKCLLLLIPYLT